MKIIYKTKKFYIILMFKTRVLNKSIDRHNYVIEYLYLIR